MNVGASLGIDSVGNARSSMIRKHGSFDVPAGLCSVRNPQPSTTRNQALVERPSGCPAAGYQSRPPVQLTRPFGRSGVEVCGQVSVRDWGVVDVARGAWVGPNGGWGGWDGSRACSVKARRVSSAVVLVYA